VFENKMMNNNNSNELCRSVSVSNLPTETPDTEREGQQEPITDDAKLGRGDGKIAPSIEEDYTCSSSNGDNAVVQDDHSNAEDCTMAKEKSDTPQDVLSNQQGGEAAVTSTAITNEMEDDKEESNVVVRDGPLKMIRKGAVAAVGGTMFGVGLVMIPLPTPFGAVIASSGLAVLGTEFKEAKEMNERLIEGAKGLVRDGRERIVRTLESMESEDFDADQQDAEKQDDSNSTSEKMCDGEDDNCTNDAPKWLHMNPIERERQERLAREKYRRENQSTYQQTKEYITKKTGSFLSRNILPLLKEKKKEIDEPNVEVETEVEESQTERSTEKVQEEGYVIIKQKVSSSLTLENPEDNSSISVEVKSS
jgi:hypothetical protein